MTTKEALSAAMSCAEVLSKFYGQPVVAGYTNAGWPVVRPANDPAGVIAGGLGGEVAPAVEALLRAQAVLAEAVEEFDRETDESRERADYATSADNAL